MRPFDIKRRVRVSAILISFVIFFSSVCPASAEKSVSDLENKTSGLKSELSNLNKELKTLEKDLDQILSQVKETSTRLETTKKSLAIATGKEQAQYESMTLRIKYMYENGNLGAIELLFSSSCLNELISRAEYILVISEYDRKLLKEFSDTRKEIELQEKQLQEDQAYLKELQADLDAKEKELKTKIASTSQNLSSYMAKLEDAKDKLNDAQSSSKEEIKPVTPSTGNSGNSGNTGNSGNSGSTGSTPSTGSGGVSYTADDVTLLAALIECEAGSTNYEGMLAVGSVVVNRMKHSKFPNTLRGVVYHTGQFPPAHDGKVDRVLNRGVKASCVKAATDALNGKNNVGSCLYFRAASSGRQGIIIGSNVFF